MFLLLGFINFVYGQAVKRNYKTIQDTIFVANDIIKAPNITFRLGQCIIHPEYGIDSVKKIAQFLKKHINLKFEIGIHSDTRGKNDTVKKISECRANEIFNYLSSVEQIPTKNFTVKGYGNSQPLIKEAKILALVKKNKLDIAEREDLYAINRRIEIKILNP